MRQLVMNSTNLAQQARSQHALVAQLGGRKKVRDLADFLGLDSYAVAEGLIEAVRRDSRLRLNLAHRHAA